MTMHVYYQIREAVYFLLDSYGLVEGTTESNANKNGLISTLFESADNRIMLTWDERNEFGYAEIWENNSWSKLSNKVMKSSDIVFKESIDKLCREIKSYL